MGNELAYIEQAYTAGKIAGDGELTSLCSQFIEQRFKADKVLFTTSGSDALEIAALLSKLLSGDEVIMPSYTFVSTANAIVLWGAKPVFCDIREDNLNIDESQIELLVNEKTKVIMPVHYASVACDMDVIMDIASRHKLLMIEDAALGINAKYKGRFLGTIGHLGVTAFTRLKTIPWVRALRSLSMKKSLLKGKFYAKKELIAVNSPVEKSTNILGLM